MNSKQDTPSEKVAQDEIKQIQPKMSFFKKLVIVFVVYMAYTQIHPYFKEKNRELDHFKSDLKEDETFDLTFVLHDLNLRTSDTVHRQRQVNYKTQQNAANFTLNLSRADLAANPNRYKLETHIVYNSQKLGHAKVIGCYSSISKEMEAKIKTDEYYSSIEKDQLGKMEPHIYSKLYVQLVHDPNVYDFTEDEIINHLYQQKPTKRTKPEGQFDYFYPSVDCNNYWTLRRDKIPLSQFKDNSTVPIYVEFDIPSVQKYLWSFKFYIAENTNMPYLNDIKMFEEFKMILSDNGFYYLVVLFSVNFLHSLFSVLSMKNNISFFRGLKSTKGISMRKHYTDILFQSIIILYLIENETSVIVVGLSILETLLSVWIVLRMTKLEKRPDHRFPYYQFQKSAESTEDETEKFDQEATSLLSKIFFPILGIYYVYSFATTEKIEYYSFILKNLVAFIHAVGFINMTPQVYINYRLKSVDFMPWKGMIYQFLNTIVDDLFAFAVKMPTLQRISVFRDDLIFVIYLYQKWIYRKNVRKEKEE